MPKQPCCNVKLPGRARLTITLMAAIIIGWVALPLVAQAHGELVQTWPPDLCSAPNIQARTLTDPVCAGGIILDQSPAEVKLKFSEPVYPIRHGLTVTGPSGQSVEQGSILTSRTELSIAINAAEAGTYRVNWLAVSEDTHPLRGSFAFSVRTTSPPSGSMLTSGDSSQIGLILQILGRLAHFTGYAIGFGALFFKWIALDSLSFTSNKDRLTPDELEKTIMRLAGWGVRLLLLAEPVSLLGQTASLKLEQIFDSDVIADMLSSSFGRVMAQRAGAAILLWVLLGNSGQGAVWKWGVTSLYMGLALVDGQASHAVIAEPVWAGLTANTLHLAAMGLWVGGLAALLAVWQNPVLINKKMLVIRRFGQLAALALFWLAVSGSIMAWLQLSRPAALFDTTYGLILLLKLGTLVVVLSLAVVGARSLATRQARWWQYELCVMVVVLSLAGLLVSIAPSK